MHIQYAESLKAWLTGVLEPLCDADPSALARYVLALLKKDKPVKELQQCMAEQLDVFLGAETEPFVDRLFVVIQTEEYKTAADTLAEAAEPDPSKADNVTDKTPSVVATKPAKECTPPLFDAINAKAKDSADIRNGDSDAVTPTASSITTNSSSGSGGGGGTGGTTLISPITAPHSKESGVASGHGKYSSSREDNHARESRRRRGSNHRSRSPRSRSRSYDRSRRSRSRDRRPLESGRANLRSSNYNNNNNNNRNKSPIVLGGGRNRYDRPKNERAGYRHPNRNRSPSPTRSLSPSPDIPTASSRRKERSMSPNATTATLDLEPPKKRQRCRDFDEKGYCMRGETCEWDHGVDPVVLEDINNPALLSIQSGGGGGPMVRGNGGQLHGEYSPDAPDLWNRSGVNYMANRGPLAGRLGGVAGGNNGPQSVGVFPRAPLGFRGPTVGGATGFPFPANPTATPLQRELIPVPVLEGGQGGVEMTPQQQHQQMMKKRYEPEDSVAIAEGGHPPPMMNMNMNMGGGGGHKRKLPMNSRLGPRMGGPPGGQQQNCSLELRKIPRGLNAIAHLNNHFSKFGKIVNIQISYEGDPEAAIVTFSTHAEANVAYRSTEAVLNNRFIKVFWHSINAAAQAPPESNLTASGLTKSENKMSLRRQHPPSQPVGVPAPPVPAATDASGQPVSTTTTATPGGGSITTNTTTTTPPATTASKTSASNAAIISANHLRLKNQRINRAATEIIRKKQEEQVKTAVQLAHGLHKRKHDLLQEYLKQMRSLVELVERTDHADPQRPPLLTTIKDLQASIDKLKKEIEQEQVKISAQAQNQPPQRKTKEQQQKELLDVELELITQEHGGSTDTANIRKRYQELQRSLQSAKSQIGAAGRTPANIRPTAPRLAPHGTTSVDRRTTTVQIVGFAADDADALLGHFKHYGEITKNVLDKDVPFLQITYATRVNAEQAILRGKKFKDSVLQLTWVSKDIAPVPVAKANEEPQTTTPTSSQQTNNNTDEQSSVDLDMDTTPNLNLEEDEEDVESEDRSWRR